jgi:predicted nucleic acid-binding protein
VLVALVDERDDDHREAMRDLHALRAGPFATTSLVLGETCFLLPDGYQRRRLLLLLQRIGVTPIELDPPWWSDVFASLDRYAEHTPDLADAQLATLSSRLPRSRVWTYDREFVTTWRREDGTPIPLAQRRGPVTSPRRRARR